MKFTNALTRLIDPKTKNRKLTRQKWDGRGLFVRAQWPDERSKMSSPYLYITDPTALMGPGITPWTPSQADLFEDDWVEVK